MVRQWGRKRKFAQGLYNRKARFCPDDFFWLQRRWLRGTVYEGLKEKDESRVSLGQRYELGRVFVFERG